jgi:hypothetical protein
MAVKDFDEAPFVAIWERRRRDREPKPVSPDLVPLLQGSVSLPP